MTTSRNISNYSKHKNNNPKRFKLILLCSASLFKVTGKVSGKNLQIETLRDDPRQSYRPILPA